uniref:Uncharacterized protein n=1 Tax=Aureoumbra lagunensis TaxID=44058 RepID=A0A7S3NGF4_9STRA
MSVAWLDGARHPDGKDIGARFGKRVAIEGVRRTTSRLDHVSSIDGKSYLTTEEKRNEKGLRATKFRLGFERRQNIEPYTERKEQEKVLEGRRQVRSQIRREQLLKNSDINRYNPITGAYDPFKKAKDERGGVKRLSDKPSEERIRAGEIYVRNSKYRFYTPTQYGSSDHVKRQELLLSGGLSKPKFSSILGVGRDEAPSFGVEDQFSKSCYQPRQSSLHGLVEKSKPGAYPPPHTSPSIRRKAHLVGATWRSTCE